MSRKATRWLVLAAVLGFAAPLASAAVPDEDRAIVATEAERRTLLDRLEGVVECARRAGYHVPDPVAVDAGARSSLGRTAIRMRRPKRRSRPA